MLNLETTEKRLKTKWKTVLFSILGIQLLMGLLLFDPKMDVGGDNAYYIHLAQRLINFQGYTTAFEPGPPKAYSHHPFGFPLLLAPIAGATGGNVVALKFFVMLMGLGATYLTFLVFRKETDSLLLPIIIALSVAVNSQVIEYSHWILSEVPFLFISLLTILLFFRSEELEENKAGKWFLLTVLAMAFTIHMRTIGAILPAAALLHLVVNKRWKRLGLLLLGVFLLVFPWMVRNKLLASDDASYATQLLLKNNFNPSEGYVTISDILIRIWNNIKFYSIEATSQFNRGTAAGPSNQFTVKVLTAIFCGFSLLGLIIRLIRRHKIIDFYTLFYLGVIAIWPYTFRSVRFLIPACPFLFFYLYYFFHSVSEKIIKYKKISVLIPYLVVFFICLSGVVTQAINAPANLTMLKKYLAGDKYAGYILPWKHFFMAADWAKKNTPSTATFVVRKPSLFYVHSGGRKVREFPLTSDREEMFNFLLSANFVLINMMYNADHLAVIHRTTGDFLIPAMQNNMKNFALVYSTDTPTTYIFMTSQDTFEEHMNEDQFLSLFGNGRKDYERAIQYYEGVIKKNPKDWNNYFRMAYFFQQLGENEKSDKYYDEAFKLDPDDTNFLLQLGGYLYSEGKLEKAITALDKLLKVNPKDIQALLIKSRILKEMGNFEQAIIILDKALEIEPGNIEALEDKAYVYILSDNFTEAENFCNQIIEKDPDNLKANLGLGRVYMSSPETYDKALYYLKKTRELAPDKTQQLDENFIIPLEKAIEEFKRSSN